MEINKEKNRYSIELVKENMSSMDLANFVGKRHDNILASIKKMESSWENVTGLKFKLSDYRDSTGRKLPAYDLNKAEILFIASKYNDELRARIIIRLAELEMNQKKVTQSQLDYFWDKSDQKDLY